MLFSRSFYTSPLSDNRDPSCSFENERHIAHFSLFLSNLHAPEKKIDYVRPYFYLLSIYTEKKKVRNTQYRDGCCPSWFAITFNSHYSM